MTTNTKTWTQWLKNPGDGVCPVPEWAEEYQVDLGNGEKPTGNNDADEWEWRQSNVVWPITHYRYAVPEDLAWLAREVQRWTVPSSWLLFRNHDDTAVYCTQHKHLIVPSYTKDQWHRARQDLGLESAIQRFGRLCAGENVPEFTDNGGDWQSTSVADIPTYDASAPGILNAALGHMQDRATTYDKPEGERSMKATVEAMEDVTGVTMTEEQGWLFMALLKAVRSQQGNLRMDSYEDGAAYFGLAGEAAAKERGE